MANDFSSDGDCKALWRFEDGALTTDSKGSNTLTNYSATANTSDYKEGGASADFNRASDHYMEIADTALQTGFPTKSGESNKTFSVCFWLKLDVLQTAGVDDGLITKYQTAKFSWAIVQRASKLRLILAYGAGYEGFYHGTNLQTGRWYHVGMTYDNSDKSYRIRIWDDTAEAIHGTDLTGTATLDANKLAISDAALQFMRFVSGTYDSDGRLDEVVVFDRVLSVADIDKIRQGTYGATTTTTTTAAPTTTTTTTTSTTTTTAAPTVVASPARYAAIMLGD